MLNVYTTGLYCTGSTRKEGAFDTTHNVFKFDVSACAALTKGLFNHVWRHRWLYRLFNHV